MKIGDKVFISKDATHSEETNYNSKVRGKTGTIVDWGHISWLVRLDNGGSSYVPERFLAPLFEPGDRVCVAVDAYNVFGGGPSVNRFAGVRDVEIKHGPDSDGDYRIEKGGIAAYVDGRCLTTAVEEDFTTTKLSEVQAGDVATIEFDGNVYTGPVTMYHDGLTLLFMNKMLRFSDGEPGTCVTLVRANGKRPAKPKLPTAKGSVVEITHYPYGDLLAAPIRLFKQADGDWTTASGTVFSSEDVSTFTWRFIA